MDLGMETRGHGRLVDYLPGAVANHRDADTSSVSSSATILIRPFVSRIALARGTSDIGTVLHQQLRPAEIAPSSVNPTVAIGGSVKIVRGIIRGLTRRSSPSMKALCATMPPSWLPTGVAILLPTSRPVTSPPANICSMLVPR